MAKGDPVLSMPAAGGVFQPAVGIEVMITTLGGINRWALTDGVTSRQFAAVTASAPDFHDTQARILINNSIYIATADAGLVMIAGVQTK